MPPAETPNANELQVQTQEPIKPPDGVAKSIGERPHETFQDKMFRLGGDKVFAGDEPGTEEPEGGEPGGGSDGETEKKAAKSDEKKPADEIEASPDAEEAQFKALAEKRGFIIENGRVTTVERAKFREERRTHSEALKNAEAAALAKIDEARKSFDGDLTRARDLTTAIESGDPNALAKALGRKDWNELQEHFLSHQADPNYKRVLELEEWKRSQEQERERAQAEAKQREEHQARAQAQHEYKVGLSTRMKGSKDPLIAAMAEDPLFVNAIFSIQSAHYDGSGTIEPEQAAKLVQRGQTQSLVDHMKLLYERLGKAFGAQAPAEPPPPPQKLKKSPPPPGTPRPSKIEKRLNGAEWREHFSRRLAEADIEDRKAARR